MKNSLGVIRYGFSDRERLNASVVNSGSLRYSVAVPVLFDSLRV